MQRAKLEQIMTICMLVKRITCRVAASIVIFMKVTYGALQICFFVFLPSYLYTTHSNIQYFTLYLGNKAPVGMRHRTLLYR